MKDSSWLYIHVYFPYSPSRSLSPLYASYMSSIICLWYMGCKTCEKPKANYRKGLWSPEEDQRLRDYILRHGHGCWSSVPAKTGELLHSRFRSTLNSDDYGTKPASENWKRHKCMMSMSISISHELHLAYLWCSFNLIIYICLVEHLSFLRLRLAVCRIFIQIERPNREERREGMIRIVLYTNCSSELIVWSLLQACREMARVADWDGSITSGRG